MELSLDYEREVTFYIKTIYATLKLCSGRIIKTIK